MSSSSGSEKPYSISNCELSQERIEFAAYSQCDLPSVLFNAGNARHIRKSRRFAPKSHNEFAHDLVAQIVDRFQRDDLAPPQDRDSPAHRFDFGQHMRKNSTDRPR